MGFALEIDLISQSVLSGFIASKELIQNQGVEDFL